MGCYNYSNGLFEIHSGKTTEKIEKNRWVPITHLLFQCKNARSIIMATAKGLSEWLPQIVWQAIWMCTVHLVDVSFIDVDIVSFFKVSLK